MATVRIDFENKRILIHRKSIENLTSERYIYFGVPLNLEKMDATWVRALAFEEK